MRLKDKVVIITASTRGIGLACVKACAREGARVYMAARDPVRAQIEADQLSLQGCHVRCVHHDALGPETYAAMAEQVASEAGRIDVLVNNFGTSDPRKDLDVTRTDPEVFLHTVELNVGSVFRATQAVLPHMRDHGGSIINISSVAGSVADVSQAAYGTGKAAIDHLTRLTALQLARFGIRCNAVAPGMTATESVAQKLSDGFKSQFLRHIPLSRLGMPEEIAGAVVYLASDEAAYTTGQLLTVSGGFGLGTPLYAGWMEGTSR